MRRKLEHIFISLAIAFILYQVFLKEPIITGTPERNVTGALVYLLVLAGLVLSVLIFQLILLVNYLGKRKRELHFLLAFSTVISALLLALYFQLAYFVSFGNQIAALPAIIKHDYGLKRLPKKQDPYLNAFLAIVIPAIIQVIIYIVKYRAERRNSDQSATESGNQTKPA